MTMLNILCTDFISEFYGRRRANFVVWVGVLLNGIILLVMWLGGFFIMVVFGIINVHGSRDGSC